MEEIKDSNTHLYCMYCGDKHRPKFMRIKNGSFDICMKPECFEIYKKSKKMEKARARSRKLNEKIDPTWMIGE